MASPWDRPFVMFLLSTLRSPDLARWLQAQGPTPVDGRDSESASHRNN
jgi:hypothetical protein